MPFNQNEFKREKIEFEKKFLIGVLGIFTTVSIYQEIDEHSENSMDMLKIKLESKDEGQAMEGLENQITRLNKIRIINSDHGALLNKWGI